MTPEQALNLVSAVIKQQARLLESEHEMVKKALEVLKGLVPQDAPKAE